ncbi:hypothetical protein PGRAT_28805 [Paenibacillus graminis]|uniref:Uncharacterized protein n=1 Tax=Paenibacillus graminis TaxID=189425 RepID=A0A089MCX0_9BACL|nr:hypothetical protein PGRAT_28805 [Paenibacillus graminis]
MAAQNEPLVTHLYTADPSAHVFKGKLYIYPSHDIDHDGPTNDNGDQYAMEDYHVLSMENISRALGCISMRGNIICRTLRARLIKSSMQ